MDTPVAAARGHGPSWSDIVDTDFEVFVANLRSVECPRETIRDILESVVFQRISERRREVLEPLQQRFWEIAVTDDEFLDSFTEPVDILRQEQKALMNQIPEYLGEESDTGLIDREKFDEEFSYLNPVTRDRLFIERSDVDRLRSERGGPDDFTSEEYWERMKDLVDSDNQLLRELMTPDEYEEYRLRNTGHASWASDLVGFEPTPAELRAVARLRLEHDDQMNSISQTDEAGRAERARLDALLEDQTRSILGTARYEEMKRAQSDGYRELHHLAERFGLSPNQSTAAFEARGAASEEARRVSQSYSGEARDELLIRIRTATEVELRSNLGDEAYEAYLRHGGAWIDGLTKVADDEP